MADRNSTSVEGLDDLISGFVSLGQQAEHRGAFRKATRQAAEDFRQRAQAEIVFAATMPSTDLRRSLVVTEETAVDGVAYAVRGIGVEGEEALRFDRSAENDGRPRATTEDDLDEERGMRALFQRQGARDLPTRFARPRRIVPGLPNDGPSQVPGRAGLQYLAEYEKRIRWRQGLDLEDARRDAEQSFPVLAQRIWESAVARKL